MRPKAWHRHLLAAILIVGSVTMGCDEKATEPEGNGLDVSNDNPHCGLVAGFVRDADGHSLPGVSVSISPMPTARGQGNGDAVALDYFLNYPNPFSSDCYFAYYLTGQESHTVRISVYDLHQELQREFSGAPATTGANKLHFDGCDNEQTVLPNGLYPCEILVQSAQETDSLRIALAKNVNIADLGGLQSYTVTTSSDGKYVIADVPLNILLQTTTIFAPEDTLVYPVNWPYVVTSRTITDRFIVSASKQGYVTATDTVTLNLGQVVRLDLVLQ